MNLQEDIMIVGQQPCSGFKGTYEGDFFVEVIQNLGGRSVESNIYFLLSQAYTFGLIQGKREERARRKKIL